MDTLLRDIRYAFTVMRRNTGFSAAVLLTLAAGIGATTAVFSIVYGVLLRPLPYPDAARLVRVSEEHPGAVSVLRQPMLSNLTFHAWRSDPKTIDRLAAYSYGEYTVTLPSGSARLVGAPVTPSLFALFGIRPALGRFFRDEETRDGANAVLVLSDRGWRERFNADPDIVGRNVVVDGKPYTVVGVAPPDFRFPEWNPMVWTPLDVLEPSPDAVAGQRGRMMVLWAIARLKPGATPAQAEAEGTAAARSTVRPMAANMLFGVGGPPVVHARGVVEEMTSRLRVSLLVLAAAVACVLLIACANVASLFLSRGLARQRELTVRAAIGAGRRRLVQQLITESAVYAAIGGITGVAIASALVSIVPRLDTRDFPRFDGVRIDAAALAFAAAATVLTTILCGLAPALRAARVDLAGTLHGGDGATAGGFRGARAGWLRDLLLVAESSFAVLLLVGATLLARSFVRLVSVDAGYTPERVLITEIFLPEGDRPDQGPAMQALVASTVERARALPGVTAAGAGNMMPLDAGTQIAGFTAPWTRPDATPVAARSIQYVVTPGYAEALGLRLKRGRLFRDTDGGGDVRPWIVNEEFARQYLPPDPVGFQWKWPATPTAPERVNEIVGVVANVLKQGNDAPPQPEHYQPPRLPMRFFGHVQIATRTLGDASAQASAMRGIVRELSPSAAVETRTLASRVSESVARPRLATAILGAFAALALILASLGLYSVLSYGVSQRRRELGVRAALGAGRGALIGLVLREGLGVTVIGLCIGLAAAAMLTRLMQAALFGVTPLDAVSFVTAPALLGLVAVSAALIPAWRAARIDPAQALRE
jgi:predicted permease